MDEDVEEIPPIDLTGYKVKKKSIGSGTFSYVKLVTKDGKDYAEKILYTTDLTNKTDVLYFRREIYTLDKYRHPTIVKFIGYGYIDEKAAIITEYAKNGSLKEYIPLDESEKLLSDTQKNIIIYGIILGISYLHNNNVIHRDLKPGNVFLDENFFPLIGDFGLAKKTDHSYIIKSKNEARGTSYYIAPESYNEDEYSKDSDVYAFAMIMYEILVVNINVVLKRNKLKFLAFPLRDFRPSFPDGINSKFKNLIKKCWSKIPRDRPESSVIVALLRKDNGFLLPNTDKDEFYKYVNLMDQKIKEIEKKVPKKIEDSDDYDIVERKSIFVPRIKKKAAKKVDDTKIDSETEIKPKPRAVKFEAEIEEPVPRKKITIPKPRIKVSPKKAEIEDDDETPRRPVIDDFGRTRKKPLKFVPEPIEDSDSDDFISSPEKVPKITDKKSDSSTDFDDLDSTPKKPSKLFYVDNDDDDDDGYFTDHESSVKKPEFISSYDFLLLSSENKKRISNADKNSDSKELFEIGKLFFYGKEGFTKSKRASNACFERSNSLCKNDYDLKFEIGKFIITSRNFSNIESSDYFSTVNSDHVKYSFAKKLLKESADKSDNSDAMVLYGLLCRMEKKGEIRRNMKEAFLYFEKAANKGNAEGLLHYGYFLENGYNVVKKDKEKAVKYYSQSNIKKSKNGMAQYGFSILNESEEKGKSLCIRAKSLNSSNALNLYGCMKLNEKGDVIKNSRVAFINIRKAALAGNPVAINNLGSFYEKGICSLEPDLEIALQLYKLALEEGAVYAAVNVARIYLKQGKPKEAKKYCQIATDLQFQIPKK